MFGWRLHEIRESVAYGACIKRSREVVMDLATNRSLTDGTTSGLGAPCPTATSNTKITSKMQGRARIDPSGQQCARNHTCDRTLEPRYRLWPALAAPACLPVSAYLCLPRLCAVSAALAEHYGHGPYIREAGEEKARRSHSRIIRHPESYLVYTRPARPQTLQHSHL